MTSVADLVTAKDVVLRMRAEHAKVVELYRSTPSREACIFRLESSFRLERAEIYLLDTVNAYLAENDAECRISIDGDYHAMLEDASARRHVVNAAIKVVDAEVAEGEQVDGW